MLAAERGRPTPPVMPRIEAAAGDVRVIMPWDPGYGAAQGEGCDAAEYPGHLRRRRSCIVVSRAREAR
jgi:hypothetical protein